MHQRICRMMMCFAVMLMLSSCQTDAEDVKPLHQIAAGARLPESIETQLCEVGWNDRVGNKLGLWVSASRQQLVGIKGKRVEFVYPCSTGEKGIGNEENSYQTPMGWHAIDERYGDGMPMGAVFVSRQYQNEVWRPGDETEKDLVLTRIMWLRGLESGVNKGKGIDSHDRFIYIHGTPAEEKIGTPASLGCIRLRNKDVIDVFNATRSGTRVLITEW